MCEDNCGNLKPERIRCEACRTINLARHAEQYKPDMQLYDKCKPPVPCVPVSEVPVVPVCIKICTREEYKMKKAGIKQICPPKPPPIGHGKLMYAVKAAIVAGTAYFTYNQGIWGDQADAQECLARWQEYIRNFNSRRPPKFDKCGKVIVTETTDSLIAPMYHLYKGIVTTCFAGIIKFPTVAKCMYIKYLKDIELKFKQEKREAKVLK